MSSLPQGWHNVTGPSKTSSTTGVSGSSVPVTIRKKWNSPLSSNVPQTKLPSYKSSNLRQQNHTLNSTYPIKPPVTSCTTAQTKLPTPTKPSPVKEYKDEIIKLKKDLSTIKAENSILKAKVRRVDDENLQKGRQIEKMRAEIKALQKSDSANSRKSKESQELHTLRQKCLRLENILKEKDMTIKKLTNEALIRKEDSDHVKTETVSTPQQIYRVSCAALPKQVSKSSEKESISAKSNLSRTSHTLKTEVTKLRDMIHKLEKENQDLQQQAKRHCQEIRRLKVQLKSKVTQPQTSVSKSASLENSKTIKDRTESVVANNPGKVLSKVPAVNSFVPKQRLVRNTKSPSQISVQVAQKQDISHKSSHQKSISKIGKISSLPSGTITKASSNKQIKASQSKLPITRSSVTRATSKSGIQKINNGESNIAPSVEKSDLEHKIQEMRENIAAKKIQRSWREHQKSLHQTAELEFQSKEKALTFIISSMKHHKLRKDKLQILVKKRNYFPEDIKKETYIEDIQSVSKKIWDQDVNTS